MSLRYALIGCGRISPNHISAALKNNLKIIAICDLKEEKMDSLIDEFNLKDETKKYISYKEMIDNENIDLIAIATESGNHAEIAKFCIKRKINLIIEKPIALSLKDIDEIINLRDKFNVIVTPCHQNRFNKSIQKIREAVETNRFGKLFHGTAHVRWSRKKDYYLQASWRGTWEQDGGVLMNQSIHNIDLLRWMMGNEIKEVFAYTDNLNHDYIEAEDLGLALIKFSNGSYGIIEGTTNIYPTNLEETLFIFGQKGTVKVGGKSVNKIEEWIFNDFLDKPDDVKIVNSENPPNVYGYGHTPLYEDVIDSIKYNRTPFITVEHGRMAVELVLAIYKSSYESTPVKLPLKDISCLDFKGKK